MIPSGLVRAKVQGSTIAPSLVDPDKPAIRSTAQELHELFSAAVSEQRRLGELLADLDERCADRRDHRMVRGMAHLARARCRLEEVADVDPVSLRDEVFRLAAARGPLALAAGPLGRPTASDVLDEVAAARGIRPDQVADALYADHEHERRVVGFDVADPAWLVHRYNVALAQSLLLRATEVVVTLQAPSAPRLRQLFRWVKFHQLLHRARRDGKALVVRLDGPMSLFRGSTRYGQQLARFLPALLLQDRPWTLKATVLWTRAAHRKDLALSSDLGLVSHYSDTGAYRTRAQEHLLASFAEPQQGWRLLEGQRPLQLGPSDLVYPDFTLTDGARVAHLEVWGHWRHEALERRLEALNRYGPGHLVVAVPSKLAAGKTRTLPEHRQILGFSELLSVRRVIAAADAVAVQLDADRDAP